jgi:hypothetical protein
MKETTMGKLTDDEIEFEHESYGMIAVSRMSGTRGVPLFGSSLEDNPSLMQVTITHGKRYHNLGHDRYYGHKEIIRLWMTPAQYAEMISNPNCGSGVPCTIRHIQGVEMDWPPEVPNEGKLVRDRFKLEAKDLMKKAQEGGAHLKAVLSTAKISQKLKDEIQGTYEKATRFLWDAAPFLVESFQDAVQKTVVEAKQEIDAFMMHALQAAGAQALADKVKSPMLLEAENGCSVCHDPNCQNPNGKH